MRRLVLVAAALCLSSPVRADTAAPGRVVVQRDRIELREPILFDVGKPTIKPQSHALLDEVTRALGDNAWIAELEIGVHTDERGADAFNLRISDERAAAVKAYLVAHGVADARVTAHGYGETRPLCKEHNEACWSRNRRVELLITKSTHK
jgi:outer membrane protein OmpA-like peptidoglycan-associated protein